MNWKPKVHLIFPFVFIWKFTYVYMSTLFHEVHIHWLLCVHVQSVPCSPHWLPHTTCVTTIIFTTKLSQAIEIHVWGTMGRYISCRCHTSHPIIFTNKYKLFPMFKQISCPSSPVDSHTGMGTCPKCSMQSTLAPAYHLCYITYIFTKLSQAIETWGTMDM